MSAGQPLDDALRSVKGVPEDKVLRYLADYFAVPYVDLETDGAKYAPSKEMLGKLPARILVDNRLMPLANFNGHGPNELTVVTSRVFDHHGIDELRLATGLDVHAAIQHRRRGRPLRQEVSRRRGRHPPGHGRGGGRASPSSRTAATTTST